MNPDLVSPARKGAICGFIISFSAAALVAIEALRRGLGATESEAER